MSLPVSLKLRINCSSEYDPRENYRVSLSTVSQPFKLAIMASLMLTEFTIGVVSILDAITWLKGKLRTKWIDKHAVILRIMREDLKL